MIEPSTWFPFRKWCAAKQFTPQHGYKLIKQGKLHTVTSGNRRYVTEAEDRRFDQVCADDWNPLDLALEIFPPISDPRSRPKGPPNEKPIIPPIKLPQIDIN